MEMDEGFRRLAIFSGMMGVLAWLVYVMFAALSEGMEQSLRTWTLIVVIMILSFLAPYAVVRAIAWVIRGFKQSKAD